MVHKVRRELLTHGFGVLPVDKSFVLSQDEFLVLLGGHLADGLLVEGIADLVFLEHSKWSVVDFKTDHELSALNRYRRQVTIYVAAVRERTQAECIVTLLRV